MSAVPCNGCRACCINQLVVLTEDDEPNSAVYDFEERKMGKYAFHMLKQKDNGECIHLGPEGCMIYDQRPVICREYDCRKQFMSMTRGQRRQLTNQTIWSAARERLASMDATDVADVTGYEQRGKSAYSKVFTRAKR